MYKEKNRSNYEAVLLVVLALLAPNRMALLEDPIELFEFQI